MKTLLLTLVVVTIVCLDLGYTLKCCLSPSLICKTFKTCPDGQCIKRWNNTDIFAFKATRECAASCPVAKSYETVKCCAKDFCNK
uniref:Three-finger toxin D.Q n=1 Tax=Micrurus diastema TaxID=39023 RepID=A0A0H4BFQ5_9SAUR|nr:three-finger toxin precursor D.Q [Micrurus diastema]